MAAAAIAAVGIGLSVYGQIKQGQAQADAAKRDADNKQAMAQETLARAAFNRKSLENQIGEQVGNQSSQYAAGNVVVGSGSPLATMENTLAMGRRKLFMIQEEADFEADQDLIGAGNERSLADQYQQAGYINSAGTLLTGSSAIASKNVGYSASANSSPMSGATPYNSNAGNGMIA